MVEITLGGSNATICHGAGRQNMTLSDLVRKIEYVDANGNLQTIENPEHLRAASSTLVPIRTAAEGRVIGIICP
jgi:hypothetical protein